MLSLRQQRAHIRNLINEIRNDETGHGAQDSRDEFNQLVQNAFRNGSISKRVVDKIEDLIERLDMFNHANLKCLPHADGGYGEYEFYGEILDDLQRALNRYIYHLA